MTHVVGLRLVNFQRYRGEHVLELGPGTYAIVAEDEADAQRSNWLGKSTLPMALRYALEGHKPKHFDAVDEMISLGESEMLVEVELSDGTFVSRKKRRDRPYDLKVEGLHEASANMIEMYQDEAQADIWRRIGFSADDLLHTAYAEQKQLDSLVAAKGTALHDVVVGWLRLAPLVEAADAAGLDLRLAAEKLKQEEVRLVAAEQQLQGLPEAAALALLVAKLTAESKDRAAQVAANSERLRQHQAWTATSDRKRTAVVQLVEVLALWVGVLCKPQPVGDAASLEQNALDAARRVDVAEADYGQKRKLAAGKFSGACPVNGEQCPVTAKINSQRDKNASLAETSFLELHRVQLLARQADAPLLAFREVNRVLQSALARLREASSRLLAYASVLEVPLQPEPPVVEALTGNAGALELARAQEQWAQRRRVEDLRTALLRDLPALRHRVVVARASLAVLGPEGAQKRVSERAVHAVERVANADLSAAGIPLSLAVRWGRETQQPARQCPQCGSAFPSGASVKVCEQCLAPRGKQFKPELRVRLSHVSGAATDLAGLAFRCAAFKWLRAKRQAPWSVAVLDEPFGSLDRANKRALAAHVQALVASTFDQAFIVAHDQALLDGLQRRIVVTGHGDWSSVAVAS